MARSSGIKLLVLLSFFFISVAASANFTQCLIDFRDSNATEGGTDYNGRPVSDPKAAVALTYKACTQWCGSGQEGFDWSVFSQQFSAWLLPWLALVSQLPFGAESRLDNLISGELPCYQLHLTKSLTVLRPVVLTVGSPTLATFSLALAAVNTRWANERFSTISFPNHRNAAKALIYLQQVPLHLTTRDGLLASLILLPENDDWWECLVDRLEQTHTWTIAAATSIAWVIIAFVFTIVDSFMNLGKNLNSNGQGVGTLWLWLIPIVVGWLWIPVCSYDKLKAAIDKANDLAFVAAPDGPPQITAPPQIDDPRRACNVSHMQGFEIYTKREVFTQDAARAAPVFNYARFWEWSSAVEMIAQAFEHADGKARRHIPVNSRREWVYPEEKHSTDHRHNRTGSIGQLQTYCKFPVRGDEEPVQPVPSGMWKRIFVASVFALGLQWATTGSAAIIVIFTPTTGLGCRSGSYILYGLISTMIWLTLLISGYLAHYAKVMHDRGAVPRSGFNSANFAKGLATLLRRLSIFAAACNTLCIILACVFQFSDFYSTCYCNSSVLGRGGQHAYNIIGDGYDYSHMKAAWIGGVVLAGGIAVRHIFTNVYIFDTLSIPVYLAAYIPLGAEVRLPQSLVPRMKRGDSDKATGATPQS
ncbi:hypothetical protein BDM02DRAFT_3128752 [Thelephora ganbajun]|uniref:Uncharacterized protein n=1 Tax=Thelephora ganbajun TaxID=370292 RepID=A0ACB6ZGU4_THEGA|nr:hypothetical protein BDM02DRAFT_3128752 [Thelephora ganbajun]